MSSEAPSGRVDAQTRRELIIQSAAGLFAERPFHEVTTKQLAEAAGVSEALVFQHFGSKQGLYMAVVADGADQFSDALHGVLRSIIALPGAGVDQLEAMFRNWLAYYLANPGMLRSFLTETNAEDARRSYYQVLLDREADMLPELEKARAEGLLPDIDPRVLLRALFTQPLSFVVTEEWFYGKELGPLDLDALPRELAHLWVSILATAPALRNRSAG